MDKVLRDHTDISIAFSSGFRKSLNAEAHPDVQNSSITRIEQPQPAHKQIRSISQEEAHPGIELDNPHPGMQRIDLRRAARDLLRPFVRVAFKALKPVLRPLAFRSRAYLTTSLNSGMEAVQKQVEIVRQQLANSNAATMQELARISVNLHAFAKASQDGFAKASQDGAEVLKGMRTFVSSEIERQITPSLERIELYANASARRIIVNSEHNEALIKTEVGYILCPLSDYALAIQLLETGELEPGTRSVIERLLRPGDIFIDVGANIGMHTLAAARALQRRGKIFAFEPYEPTANLLEKSVSMCGHSEVVEIHRAAVSRQKGHQKLFLGATSGHHSLFVPQSQNTRSSQKHVDVPTIRLDDIVPDGCSVSLLKIDVEGAELDVLEGAKSTIEQSPDIALISEFGLSHMKGSGIAPDRWLSAFSDLGFEYRVIDEHTAVLDDWTADRFESSPSVNLFFARPTSSAWAKVGGRT